RGAAVPLSARVDALVPQGAPQLEVPRGDHVRSVRPAQLQEEHRDARRCSRSAPQTPELDRVDRGDGYAGGVRTRADRAFQQHREVIEPHALAFGLTAPPVE